MAPSSVNYSNCLFPQFPDMEHSDAEMPILKVLTMPRVLVSLLTCTVGAYSIGTIEATLSQFLELQLGLGVQKIALAFLVSIHQSEAS